MSEFELGFEVKKKLKTRLESRAKIKTIGTIDFVSCHYGDIAYWCLYINLIYTHLMLLKKCYMEEIIITSVSRNLKVSRNLEHCRVGVEVNEF